MRVLLVEPYYGGSHRAWADGYQANSANDVTIISHEARFWKWRMHGAHVTLACAVAETLDAPPDVVLASSMMNVPAFIGASRHSIGGAPVAVYFHENQFSYPLSPLDRPDQTYPMVNWSTAAVADLPIFNSEFHRSLFFEEAERFLRQFPDHPHGAQIPDVEARSIVLPVAVDHARIAAVPRSGQDGAPVILWNQRWEHDKGPDEFVELIEALIFRDVDFMVAVVGEQFVSAPESFDRLPDLLGDRLVAHGFLPDGEYADILRRADIVVSTAHHEFFGIAIVEAMAAGAFPVLPTHLVYPDRIPEAYQERCLYEDHDDLVEKVQWTIDHRETATAIATEVAMTVQQYDWSKVAPLYDETLERLVASSGVTE
jgi:glycosyltransferase involved in cell wall biosynthesis